MINICCLLAICHLEINGFRIDLLTAFFTPRPAARRTCWRSSQRHTKRLCCCEEKANNSVTEPCVFAGADVSVAAVI